MNLGSLSPIQPMDVEEIKRQLSVTDLAYQAVTSHGFVFPTLPNQQYRGVLPSNLIHLDDNTLGELLGQIANWCLYADTELAQARAARNQAEEILNSISARLRLSVKMGSEGKRKPSNPELDDVVNSDPRVIEAKRNYLYAEAVFDYTKQLTTAAQRDWETASRRITQRGQEIERNRRTEGVGTVPVMSSAFSRR
jgi:hypothetical protein